MYVQPLNSVDVGLNAAYLNMWDSDGPPSYTTPTPEKGIQFKL